MGPLKVALLPRGSKNVDRSGTRQRGVTLIELMVTLAVAAVLLVMAAPSFTEFFERYRLRGAADDALTIMARARQGAVAADRDVTVRFVAGDNWCGGARQRPDPVPGGWISGVALHCECESTPGLCLVGGQPLLVDGEGRRGVTVASLQNAHFTYDSKGGTLIPAQLAWVPQVEFESSSKRYGLRVEVNALGQARACVPAGKRPITGYATCT
jgi:type IV fimbrial biogenesis protein FimT